MSDTTPSLAEALGLDAEAPAAVATTPAPAAEAKQVTLEDSSLFDPMDGLDGMDELDSMAESLEAKPTDAVEEVGTPMEDDDDFMPQRKEAGEAPAEAPVEGEEAPEGGDDADVTLTRDEYDNLMQTAENALGGQEAPTAAPEAPAESTPAPQEVAAPQLPDIGDFDIPNFEMSEDAAAEMGITDGAAFTKAINAHMGKVSKHAAAATMQNILEHMPSIAAEQANAYLPIAIAAHQFEEKHPEYANSPNLVREAIREELAKGEQVSPAQLFKNVDKKISYASKRARKIAKRVDAVPKADPGSRSTASRKTRGRTLNRDEQMLRDIGGMDMPLEDDMASF